MRHALLRRAFSSPPAAAAGNPISAWEVYGPSRWVNEKLIATLSEGEKDDVRLLSVGAGTAATDAHLAGMLRKMGATVGAFDLVEPLEVEKSARFDEHFERACGVPARRHAVTLDAFVAAKGERVGRSDWSAVLMASSLERQLEEGADLGAIVPLVELCLDVAPRVFISGPLANPLYAALFTHKDSGEADGGLFVRTGMLEKITGATAEFATVPQLMDVTEIEDEEGLLTSLHFDGDMAEDHTRAFVATLIQKVRVFYLPFTYVLRCTYLEGVPLYESCSQFNSLPLIYLTEVARDYAPPGGWAQVPRCAVERNGDDHAWRERGGAGGAGGGVDRHVHASRDATAND